VLPDRVIWVNAPQTRSGIRLVETQGTQRAPYLALSYCWGPVSASTFLTDASTLAARKAGILASDLPPLFQDIVLIARELGIYYVWIDRLCIIQGSSADFEQQAPKMGAIYGNAVLTITAASAVCFLFLFLSLFSRRSWLLTHREDVRKRPYPRRARPQMGYP
jgi:hypothetical protein